MTITMRCDSYKHEESREHGCPSVACRTEFKVSNGPKTCLSFFSDQLHGAEFVPGKKYKITITEACE